MFEGDKERIIVEFRMEGNDLYSDSFVSLS